MAKNFLKNLFGTGDENEGFMDYEDGYDVSSSAVTEEEAGYSSYDERSDFGGYKSPSKILNMHSVMEAPKLCLMKPTGYDEVMTEAVEKLRAGTIIFLNLTGIDKEIGTRIVDFMTGVAAYAEGRIKKVDTCCYAIAPKNVEWIENIDDL